MATLPSQNTTVGEQCTDYGAMKGNALLCVALKMLGGQASRDKIVKLASSVAPSKDLSKLFGEAFARDMKVKLWSTNGMDYELLEDGEKLANSNFVQHPGLQAALGLTLQDVSLGDGGGDGGGDNEVDAVDAGQAEAENATSAVAVLLTSPRQVCVEVGQIIKVSPSITLSESIKDNIAAALDDCEVEPVEIPVPDANAFVSIARPRAGAKATIYLSFGEAKGSWVNTSNSKPEEVADALERLIPLASKPRVFTVIKEITASGIVTPAGVFSFDSSRWSITISTEADMAKSLASKASSAIANVETRLQAPIIMDYTRHELSAKPYMAFAVERSSKQTDASFKALFYYKDELPYKLTTNKMSEAVQRLEQLLGLAGLVGHTSKEAASSSEVRSPRLNLVPTPTAKPAAKPAAAKPADKAVAAKPADKAVAAKPADKAVADKPSGNPRKRPAPADEDICNKARILAGILDSEAANKRKAHEAMLIAFVHTMDIAGDISTAKLAAEKAAFLQFPTDPKAKQLVDLADKVDECRAKAKELDDALNVHLVPGLSNAQLEAVETAITCLMDARVEVVRVEADLKTLLEDADPRAIIDA